MTLSCYLKMTPFHLTSHSLLVTPTQYIPSLLSNLSPSPPSSSLSDQNPPSQKHKNLPQKKKKGMAVLSFFTFFTLIIFLHSATVSAQSPAAAPAPSATNVTAVLEKAGQFTTLIKLLKSTRMADQIDTQLSTSNQGITLFAPTDNAFSSLKSGTLNSISEQQKLALMQFHVLPNFYSVSQFQTVSNPLHTQAGNSNDGQFPLNVTTAGNQVNITTGVVNATVANTIFTDNQLAVYEVDQVLLPLNIFGPAAPAPAPSAPKKSVKGADAPSGSSDTGSTPDASAAMGLKHHGMIAAILAAVFL